MGVVNTTPDSFYESSRVSAASCLPLVSEMVANGVDWVDVGGESTRPGSTAVSVEEEISRVIPVIEVIHQTFPNLSISIDTCKAEVARLALLAGASAINDVTALRHDASMASLIAETGVPVILMHMQGTPRTMQVSPTYTDVVQEVCQFFEERIQYACAAGISKQQIVVDPGIGFGKTLAHNVQILHNIPTFVRMGYPVLIGTSRKNWIGLALSSDAQTALPPEDRLEGSIAAALWSLSCGASVLRVHDVKETQRAIRIWQTLQKGKWMS